MFEFDNEPFSIGDILIQPLNVMHYRLPVKAFRIRDFAYVTDANFIPEEEKSKLRNLKVLVLNTLRREPHVSHFTFDQGMAMAKELGAEKTYFIHISHQLGRHADVMRELPPEIELAVDGLQVIAG